MNLKLLEVEAVCSRKESSIIELQAQLDQSKSKISNYERLNDQVEGQFKTELSMLQQELD